MKQPNHKRCRDADVASDSKEAEPMNPTRKFLAGGALAIAALTGGAIGASVFGVAGAQTSTTTAPTDSSDASRPAHGSADHEGAEKAVTGDSATKAQAAAVQSLGGGTAGAVTSDYNGGGFEVTVTKADGSQVEVHLNSSFAVQGHGGH